MNVALVRVDSRLIHGQIIEAWVPHTAATAVVVLNDAAAASELTRSVMTMCVPPSVLVIVAKVSETAEVLARPDLAAGTVIVLLATPGDALAAYDAGLRFSTLNLGNLHFAPGKRQVSTCVSLGDDDRQALRALSAKGVAIEARAVPRDRPTPYRDLVAQR